MDLSSSCLTTSFFPLCYTLTYLLDISATLDIAPTVLPASTLSSYTCCSPLPAPNTTDPGWLYRHSQARNAQTYDHDRSCTQGQARVPGTLERTCTASAGVSLSQLSFVRQASFDCPAPLDSHARAPGYMPILRVVERWGLCLAPLGLYKAFGHENHLAHGSPEVAPSSTSPFYSTVLVRVIILTGILTGIRMYKYQRLQGNQGNACSSKAELVSTAGRFAGNPGT